jgi:hypothetical protein
LHLGYSGADPGFQVRGSALKKIAPSRGRREMDFVDIILTTNLRIQQRFVTIEICTGVLTRAEDPRIYNFYTNHENWYEFK